MKFGSTTQLWVLFLGTVVQLADICTGDQKQAVQGLIQRLLPERYSEFVVNIQQDFTTDDWFEIHSFKNHSVLITASGGVAAASGFYYYLKNYCYCHVSWTGDQLDVPKLLPFIQQPIRIWANPKLGKFRYYENVCTPSYSFVWWNWTRWEREIDWMAMNGINLPLAVIGQEAIWRRTFIKLGLTEAEVDAYYSGPAYLAWQTMGNIHGLNGPLTKSWLTEHVDLQHKILDRMRQFGMKPVLPAFSGHVPGALHRVYPNASISRLGEWSHFNCTYACTSFLDPTDPLFKTIGKMFLTELVSEFGSSPFFSADSFNEMTPKSSEANYLAECGRAVYESMAAIVPEAVWVMQAWLFFNSRDFWKPTQVKAYVTSVPLGKLVLLDLYAEMSAQYQRFDSFYGVPFIWCMLNNFGGTVGMHGALQIINKGPFEAVGSNSSIMGIGLTPEGIGSNNVIYEFMMENAWRTQPRNTTAWLVNYAKRRYSVDNGNVSKAWTLLQRSVYNETVQDHGKYYLVTRPTLTKALATRHGFNKLHYAHNPHIWYDPEDVYKAWDYFIRAASSENSLTASSLFQHDLIDVTRQCLQLLGYDMYKVIVKAYNTKNLKALADITTRFLELLGDVEDILASGENFLLGKWLANAKAWGRNEMERRQYEYNARMQITLWGPDGEIVDYAAKQWSGMVKSYYKPRWKLFFTMLTLSLIKEVPFNQTEFNQAAFSTVEQPFVLNRSAYPVTPIGNPWKISSYLHAKYRSKHG